MAFEGRSSRTDLEFHANTGTAKAEIGELRRAYHQSTGAMSDDALRLAVAQEKLDRALAKTGPTSTRTKQATLGLRREMDALAREQTQTAQSADRASGALAREERTVSRFSRGALAGTGVMRGFGRSIAFASSTFLGGAGLVYAIKSTITAAERQEVVLGQTENAVQRSGQSWAQYGKQIQEAALAQSKISGFDDEELLGTFSRLVRRTKDVNEALRLNALAADVARGRNISLEAATQLVLKASLGQAGALRRLGIEAQKGATATQLLELLQRSYAGSAEKYGRSAAGAQDRFRVAIENTQEAIGAGLLPEITALLNKGADWLNDSKNQERVVRDVTTVLHDAGDVARGFATGIDLIRKATRPVVDALGGLENAAETALIVGLVLKAQRAAVSFGLIRVASATTRTAVIADAEAMEVALDTATRPRVVPITVVPGGGPGGIILPPGVGGGTTPTAPTALKPGGPAWLLPFLPAIAGLGSDRGTPEFRNGHWYLGGKELSPSEARALGLPARPKAGSTGQTGQVRNTGGVGAANTLPVPTTDTHGASLLSAFGADRGPNLDAMRAPGTVVGSPVNGVVTRLSGQSLSAGWSNGPGSAAGYSIYILAEDGSMYFLTHFSSVLVKAGDPVRRGTPIGVVANLGLLAGGVPSHIHEEKSASKVTPPAGTTPAAPLGSAERISNRISQARLGIARGVPGAKTELIAALRDQIEFDRRYEKIQEDLLRRGVGDRKKHAQILEQLRSAEAGALTEIQSLLEDGKSGGKSESGKGGAGPLRAGEWATVAANRVNAAVAERARQVAARQRMIDQLGGPSIDRQIDELKLQVRQARGQDTTNEELKLLDREQRDADREYHAALKVSKTRKKRDEVELAYWTEKARIQGRSAELRSQAKQKTSQASEDAKALIREFVSEFNVLVEQYAPNVTGGKGTNVTVVQNFPHPPTTDGNREATYAKNAHRAVFD